MDVYSSTIYDIVFICLLKLMFNLSLIIGLSGKNVIYFLLCYYHGYCFIIYGFFLAIHISSLLIYFKFESIKIFFIKKTI